MNPWRIKMIGFITELIGVGLLILWIVKSVKGIDDIPYGHYGTENKE